MAKRKTVILPDYPAILLTAGAGDKNASQCLDALAIHYGIASKDGRFLDKPFEEFQKRWAHLAVCLARDFVPAFRIPRKGGAPKQSRTQGHWLYPRAHEARLVQIIAALRKQLRSRAMPATNKDAYRALIRILNEKPAPKWRYGLMRKTASFAQAWKSIPSHVKSAPEAYLPPPPVSGGGLLGVESQGDHHGGAPTVSNLGFGGLFGLGSVVLSEAALVWDSLPPLPK